MKTMRTGIHSYIGGLLKKTAIFNFLIGGNRGVVVWLSLMTLLSGIADMISVASILPVLQAGMNVLGSSDHSTGSDYGLSESINLLARLMHLSPLAASGFLLLLISFLTFIFKIYYAHFSQVVACKIMTGHKQKLFNLIARAEYERFLDFSSSELIHLYTISTGGIVIVVDYFARLFSQVITIISLLLLMFFTVPKFIAPAFVVGILYFVFSRIFIKKYVENGSIELNNLKIAESHVFNEYVTGVKTIRFYGDEKNWQKKIWDNLEQVSKYTIRVFMGFSSPSVVMQLILGLSISILAIYMSGMDSGRILTFVPAVGVFVLAASRLNSAITAASNSYSAILNHMPQVRSVYRFITSVDQTLDDGVLPKHSFNQSIIFSGVNFTYKNRDIPALRDFNATIQKGYRVGLIGGSGSGKSTLVNLLIRLFEPSAGKILMDGTPINKYLLQDFYNLFAIVNQDTFLLHASVEENISFGGIYSSREIVQAAKDAGADKFIMELPQGYETLIGSGGLQLSGGQRQRIAIARALIRHPQILILDEPTNALDSISEAKVMDTINLLDKSITIIMITHNKNLISDYDLIVDLNK